jgi:hemin uptake protein HemP
MAGTRPDLEQAAAPHRSSTQPAKPLPGCASGAPTARRWRSAELFGPLNEIEIEHGHAVYRLRLTSLGKLILTK